jgi:hypothetical protein
VIVDQPFDGQNGLASYGWGGLYAQAADDVFLPNEAVIDRVTCTMTIRADDKPPAEYGLDVFPVKPPGEFGIDEYPSYYPIHRVIGASAVRDLGEMEIAGIAARVFEVTFDVDLGVDPGRYWLSAFAPYSSGCWFGTSGIGTPINGHQGYWRYLVTGPGFWELSEDVPGLGYPTDLAMRVEGHAVTSVPVEDFHLAVGRHMVGDLEDLRVFDEDVITCWSNFNVEASEPHIVEVHFGLTCPVEEPQRLFVLSATSLNDLSPPGRAEIRLRNWATGELDLFDEHSINSKAKQHQTIVPDPADFIRPDDGRIELSIRHVMFEHWHIGYQTYFDWVEVFADEGE